MNHLLRHAEEGIFTLKQKPGLGLCVVRGCRKDCHRKKMSLCHMHWQHRWRMKSPKRSAYATLKSHAVARGLEFNLTYDYYCGMLDCAGYWDQHVESRGEILTLDRRDSTKGYTMGNVRVITLSENVAAGNRVRFLPESIQSIIARKRAKAQERSEFYAHEDESRNPF